MDNKIVLQALVNDGALTQDASKKLLQEASLAKRDVEELLYDRRLVTDEAIARVKSALLKVPYKKVDVSAIRDDLVELIPEETVRNYKVIPIERKNDLLVVGMVNPDDAKAQDAIKFIAKQQRITLGVYLISREDWELMLRRYSSYRSEVEMAVRSLGASPKRLTATQRIVELEAGAGVSDETPIIKIVASTLREAVYEKASDIHFEPLRNRMRIRFRIDGDLEEVASLPIELHQLVTSRVKVLAELKLDETRIPQDGRFRTVLLGRDIDFRVASFPTAVGEKIALRVLDPTVGLKGLGDLGLVGRNAAVIKAGIDKPYGMVLITGPTGSGKTTTLYAIMEILNKEDVNIVSLEDPVEYFMEGINQSQVRPEIGYDFASGLRQILRQDPDVIMIGEIRDDETAGLAVHSALTGHIVLSTLHTNNTLGVIPRLIDMHVEPFLLPASLNLMMAQRLVSRLCEACRKPAVPSGEIADIIKRELSKLPRKILDETLGGMKEVSIYRAPGCDTCKGKGMIGRIALFEALSMTPELENIVTEGPTEHKILEEARRQGMISLRQDGILKALQGLVPIEEVLRETTEV